MRRRSNMFALTSSSCSLLWSSSARCRISSWIKRAYSKSCSSLQDSQKRKFLLTLLTYWYNYPHVIQQCKKIEMQGFLQSTAVWAVLQRHIGGMGDCVCVRGGDHLQLSGGLSEEGALLGPLFLFLILQPFGYTDVVLHKLVFLDVGGVVLLDWGQERKKGRGLKLYSVWGNKSPWVV